LDHLGRSRAIVVETGDNRADAVRVVAAVYSDSGRQADTLLLACEAPLTRGRRHRRHGALTCRATQPVAMQPARHHRQPRC
jgi:hypothetical protein